MSNFKLGVATIPQAATATANLTASTTRPIANLHSGSRSDRFELASSSTDTLTVNYDLGASTTKTANFIALMRAKLLHRNDCTGIRLRGSTQSATLPSTLTPSAWFDPNRGVTTVSGAVSQWNDLSGNNYHATQGTAANRPLLSRADNQENFLTYSEQQSNAAWDVASYPVTVADNNTTNYLGVSTAARVTATAGSSRHGTTWTYTAGTRPIAIAAASQFILEVDVKAGTASHVWIGTSTDSPWHGVSVNVSAGSFNGAGANLADKSITSLGSGWYRVKLTITATASHRPDCGVWLGTSSNDTSPPSIVAAGTETFYMTRAQLRRTSADSSYMKSEATFQISGINGNRALVFDGSNDYLTNTAIASVIGNGSDSAFTMIVHIKPFDVATRRVWGFYSTTDADTLNSYVLQSGATSQYQKRDDAGSVVVSTGTTIAANTDYIISVVHSGTTVSTYKNGVAIATAEASNVGTLTQDQFLIGAFRNASGNFYNGYIGELIAFNSALSDPNRQAIESYLTTKYITTPIVQLDSLSTATLMGPNAEDYFSVFTETSAFRHWWLEFVNQGTASIYPCSKVLFGKALDFGREPSAPIELGLSRVNAWSREAQHTVDLKVEAVTDTVKETFLNEIAKYADVMPVVLLDPAAAFLRSTKGFHAYLSDNSIEIPNVSENNINMSFVEQV